MYILKHSAILQNIRSMRENLDLLFSNINALSLAFDIIFLTETWISTEEITNYNLNDFCFYANCNDTYRAGGVSVFIRNSIVHEVSVSNFQSADILKIKVEFNGIKICYILIYRLQFIAASTFINELSKFLQNDQTKNKIILGDINIDLIEESQIKDDYLLLCSSFGLESLVNNVTRPSSNTCLDHVFSGLHKSNVSVFIENMQLNITDHNTIRININFSGHKKIKSPHLVRYKISIDYVGLNQALQLENFNNILSIDDPMEAYTIFIEKLGYYLNKFTTKNKISNSNLKIKPWMSNVLLRKIRLKNKLSKKLRKHPNNKSLYNSVSRLNCKLKYLISITKENYYRNRLENASDLKAKWKVVDELLDKPKSHATIHKINNSNGVTLTDPTEIANVFSEFFSQIPYNLLDLHKENVIFPSRMKNSLLFGTSPYSSVFLSPILDSEILTIVRELKNSNACGDDGFSNITVKEIILNIVRVLTHIFNICLNKGTFPDKMKIGVVIPLFKKGSTLDPNNYRPINLLNTFSKIFEKLIKIRLINYFEKIKFFDKRQFGFLKNSSTEDALVSFLSPLHQHINENLKTAAIFIDIS